VKAKPELAGKRVKCPACDQPLAIPALQSRQEVKQRANVDSGTIVAKCQCGKSLRAKSALAGKRVKCPACRQPLLIPDRAQTDATTADEGLGPDDSSRAPVGSGGGTPDPDMIAGWLEEGTEQPASLNLVDDSVGPPQGQDDPLGGVSSLPAAPVGAGAARSGSGRTLPKYTRPATAKPKKRRVKAADGDTKRYVLWGAVGLVGFSALFGLFVPALGALFVLGVLLLVGLAFTVGSVWLLIHAFEEDMICGVLMLFVPMYGLYYLFAYWDDSPPFWLVGGSILANIGAIVYLFILQAFL
jgi:hypothetical protein